MARPMSYHFQVTALQYYPYLCYLFRNLGNMQQLVDGRSPWPTRISPTNKHQLQISQLDNQFNKFTLWMSPTHTLIAWLQQNLLLASSTKCDKCHLDCTMNARKKTIDALQGEYM